MPLGALIFLSLRLCWSQHVLATRYKEVRQARLAFELDEIMSQSSCPHYLRSQGVLFSPHLVSEASF